LNAITLYAS